MLNSMKSYINMTVCRREKGEVIVPNRKLRAIIFSEESSI